MLSTSCPRISCSVLLHILISILHSIIAFITDDDTRNTWKDLKGTHATAKQGYIDAVDAVDPKQKALEGDEDTGETGAKENFSVALDVFSEEAEKKSNKNKKVLHTTKEVLSAVKTLEKDEKAAEEAAKGDLDTATGIAADKDDEYDDAKDNLKGKLIAGKEEPTM